MDLINKFKWIMRKSHLKRSVIGFSAGLRSYASEDVVFSDHVKLMGNTSISNARVGRCTYFAGCIASNIQIGSFCSIGPGVRLGGLGKHPTSLLSTHPMFYSTRMQCGVTFSDKDYFDEIPLTIIGNDVWVGVNAVVLDGLKVGHGAIIAAGAVVVKDVPDYAVVGGVPAKIIKYRYSDNDIETLLKIKWWDLELEVLSQISPIIRSGCVETLMQWIEGFQNVNFSGSSLKPIIPK